MRLHLVLVAAVWHGPGEPRRERPVQPIKRIRVTVAVQVADQLGVGVAELIRGEPVGEAERINPRLGAF
jgi:hypothetical protein